MKVIGVGFGRTGTASQQAALTTLGFGPCYHFLEIFKQPDHARFWDRAAHGERVDWQSFFNGWQATVDWPGCTFYKELAVEFPEAKFILSVRDPERWYESMFNTIYREKVLADQAFLASGPPPPGQPLNHIANVMGFVNRLLWQTTFPQPFEDRAAAIEVYSRHSEEVRQSLASDRLLVFDVKEGWAPLCAFLGVPVPEGVPFPHVNDTAEFQARSEALRAGRW